jgi:hypothetical protein
VFIIGWLVGSRADPGWLAKLLPPLKFIGSAESAQSVKIDRSAPRPNRSEAKMHALR